MPDRDAPYPTVLIVEDVEDTRYFMRLAMEQLGYLVIEAADGAKAVEIALRERPDVILMDLSIPVMDGIAATTSIRANEEMREVPIIALTAHQELELRNEAKASGFDAYVTKPIDVDFLDDLIKGLLP
jgi:CheY-like chemotaxis protein